MADVNVVNPNIFKAYDVRGLYPSEVNETAAHDIGGGFVTYLGARRIAVTRDMRTSSPGSPTRSSRARASRAATSSTTACCRPT